MQHFFPAYPRVAAEKEDAYVPLDQGLSILSQHARDLGYDGLVLFLDELILWLASRAADLAFVHREGQKLVKLFESQTPERPAPVISLWRASTTCVSWWGSASLALSSSPLPTP